MNIEQHFKNLKDENTKSKFFNYLLHFLQTYYIYNYSFSLL